jgi:hypothetical protein
MELFNFIKGFFGPTKVLVENAVDIADDVNEKASDIAKDAKEVAKDMKETVLDKASNLQKVQNK